MYWTNARMTILGLLVIMTTTGCQLIGSDSDHHPSLVDLHHHREAADSAPSSAIEVGGIVARPGIIPVADDGVNLRQALLLAGGISPFAKYSSPYELLVAHRTGPSIGSVTTYYPLPLVETGLAGDVRVEDGSSISVVNRDSTSLNPDSLPGNLSLSLQDAGGGFQVRGLAAPIAGSSKGGISDVAVPGQNAEVVVLVRRSPSTPSFERFVILIDEPVFRKRVVSNESMAASIPTSPQAGAGQGDGITFPEGQRSRLPSGVAPGSPVSTDRGANPDRPRGAPDDPLAGQIPEDSRLLPPSLSDDETAGVPASISAEPAPTVAAASQPATLTTTVPRTLELARVFKGDEIQFTRTALLPEVFSGLVLPEVERGVERRISALQRLHEQRQSRLRDASRRLGENPIGRAFNATDQVLTRVGSLAVGLVR